MSLPARTTITTAITPTVPGPRYERIWDEAPTTQRGTITAVAGVGLFKPSKLGNKALRKIWDLCDVTPPHGQLTRYDASCDSPPLGTLAPMV